MSEEVLFSRLLEFSSVVPVCENVDEKSAPKNYFPVSFLIVISKVFGKHVNNRLVDHLEKCSLFYDFQHGFRSSRSTADLLTILMEFRVRYSVLFGLVTDSFGWSWMGSLHKNIKLIGLKLFILYINDLSDVIAIY